MKKIHLLLLLPLLLIPLACGKYTQPNSPLGTEDPNALCLGTQDGSGNPFTPGDNWGDGCKPVTFNFLDNFYKEFVAGINVPFLAVTALSSPFGQINEQRPTASGKLVLRDRDVLAGGGLGGGFTPQNLPVGLDFTDGNGVYCTFQFKIPKHFRIDGGSTVGFEVTNFGGDGGHLYKYISKDGSTFTQVGDDANANGVTYTFPVPAGGRHVYLKLQTGTTAGIFEGVWIGNVQATLVGVRKGCHGDKDDDHEDDRD